MAINTYNMNSGFTQPVGFYVGVTNPVTGEIFVSDEVTTYGA